MGEVAALETSCILILLSLSGGVSALLVGELFHLVALPVMSGVMGFIHFIKFDAWWNEIPSFLVNCLASRFREYLLDSSERLSGTSSFVFHYFSNIEF